MSARAPLLVAGPAFEVDPLTPWVEPVTTSDRVMSTGFWLGWNGLSAFGHAFAVALAFAGTILPLIPIPFIAAMCADVKPVERVPIEMEVVTVPPPPPPQLEKLALADGNGEGVALRACTTDADCPDDERCVDDVCVAADKDHPKKKPVKKKGHARKRSDEPQMMAMLSVLSSSDENNISAIFGSADLVSGGVEGGVVGGVLGSDSGLQLNALSGVSGAQLSEGYGYGGLGLRGTGGGGTGEGTIGLGSVGMIGRGGGTGTGYGRGGGVGSLDAKPDDMRPPQLVIDDVTAAARASTERLLAHCNLTAPISGTLVVTAGKVEVTTNPLDGCVSRRVRMGLTVALRKHADATLPFQVLPSRP